MRMFFPSFAEINPFFRSLNRLTLTCQHCCQNDQWVAHGYLYKKSGESERVGKRLLCGKRYNKKGCGRTVALYLQHIIPQRHDKLPHLAIFVLALIKANTVEQAYFLAVGHQYGSHRQAWRWLNSLWSLLGVFRAGLTLPPDSGIPPLPHRSRRLALLVSTLRDGLQKFPSINDIQCIRQARFC